MCTNLELYLAQFLSSRKEVLWSDIHHNVSMGDIIIESTHITNLDYIDYEYVRNNIDMTVKQLEYLYLYYWEGYTYEAIARKYKVSRQSVNKIIVKAKGKLYRGLTHSL